MPVYKPGAPVGERRGTGLWTRRLRAAMPWLPVEENGRLEDPALRENFVLRLFALRDFYRSLPEDARAADYVAFHSRYKYTLMAAAPSRAQALGRLVARIEPRPGAAFWRAYRQAFMAALATTASRGRHANVLMHLQGYFKRVLPPAEKAYLGALIEALPPRRAAAGGGVGGDPRHPVALPRIRISSASTISSPFLPAIARRADGAG
ncbi:MAG: hypothetical protein KatS3mg121_0042 [Gammaproteobacteria bacterium]|nr:MAG: hypothetical protein KatS3mg121_0042 [Gammaproteobacteria bacterium]